MSQESSSFEFEREVDLGREAGLMEKKLAESLDKRKAAEVAGEVYSAALEIDGTINQILREPEFISQYYYDGMFVRSKNSHTFHVAPDGVHLFKILTEGDMILNYFEANDWSVALAGLREQLDKYRKQAKSLLLHWEENKNIPSSINNEAMERIKKDLASARHNVGNELPPLTEAEEGFFREYEEQMRDPFQKENGD